MPRFSTTTCAGASPIFKATVLGRCHASRSDMGAQSVAATKRIPFDDSLRRTIDLTTYQSLLQPSHPFYSVAVPLFKFHKDMAQIRMTAARLFLFVVRRTSLRAGSMATSGHTGASTLALAWRLCLSSTAAHANLRHSAEQSEPNMAWHRKPRFKLVVSTTGFVHRVRSLVLTSCCFPELAKRTRALHRFALLAGARDEQLLLSETEGSTRLSDAVPHRRYMNWWTADCFADIEAVVRSSCLQCPARVGSALL
eukprot:3194237-Pleurochrysis_carterae.AAC.6